MAYKNTEEALRLILERLQEWGIAQEYKIKVSVEVIPDVDRVWECLPCVVSGDVIILNRCQSWINLVYSIVKFLLDVWMVQLLSGAKEGITKEKVD